VKRSLLLLTIIVYLLTACAASAADTLQSVDLTYESRSVKVPATIVLPQGEGPFPLVVMIHGHTDHRNNPGFVNLASSFASQGIASIRMDFPGCGDSTEDFSLNTESNMKQDIINGLNFMANNYPVDLANVGTFGYSMGGRLTLELIAERAFQFKAIALLAPAADTDNLELLFGGQEGWDKLKEQAQSSQEGYTIHTNEYGNDHHLSKEWFADLEKYEGSTLVREASGNFYGSSLVIYAVDDDIVAPYVSKAVADALHAQVVVVPADGHNYGFTTRHEMILNMVTTAATAFFMYNFDYDITTVAAPDLPQDDRVFAIVRTSNKMPLNFRVSDSLRAKLIGKIVSGTRVQVLSQGPEWSKIIYDNKEGYVQSSYLEPVK